MDENYNGYSRAIDDYMAGIAKATKTPPHFYGRPKIQWADTPSVSTSDTITISKYVSPKKGNTVDVTTKTVETIDGHVGQVIYKGKIVWESEPRKNVVKAQRAADRRVTDSVTDLFSY